MNPDDDLKYRDVINTLKQLQEIKAPNGFEADLMRRVNSEKKEVSKTSVLSIFTASRLVPTAALAVTAVLLIFVLDHSGVTQENPLMTAPRERQEAKISAETGNSSERMMTRNKEYSSQEEISGALKDENNLTADGPAAETEQNARPSALASGENTGNNKAGSERFITAKFNSDKITNYKVKKAGLNFRQVNLSNEQKMQLDQLKEKLELMFDNKAKQ